MNKYFVWENYLKRIEHYLWAPFYSPSRRQIEESEKFARFGFDYDAGQARLSRVLEDLGKPRDFGGHGMASVHWVLFACLSENPSFRIKRILEIGTFDGETALILSRLFPAAQITTVELPDDDPIFQASYLRDQAQFLEEFKERQSANLKSDNIVLKKINSFFLPGQVQGDFDLIWIDGGHLYPEIAWDICNAYHLCAPGGFLMVDDVIPHARGFRDAYVSPDSYKVLTYAIERTGEKLVCFLKRNNALWSAVPRRRKFVAVWRKRRDGSKIEKI